MYKKLEAFNSNLRIEENEQYAAVNAIYVDWSKVKADDPVAIADFKKLDEANEERRRIHERRRHIVSAMRELAELIGGELKANFNSFELLN